jgi:acylphosphatase
MSEQKRAHVYVSGRVQGVFFRANTRKQAQRRGLTGWVRNLTDGRVEAIFEGPEEDVREIVQRCHDGSPSARVDDVAVTWSEPTAEFDGFEVRR